MRLAGDQSPHATFPTNRPPSSSGACTCQRPLWGDGPEECPVHTSSRYIADNCCGAGQTRDNADNDGAEEAAERRKVQYALRERLAHCSEHNTLGKKPDGTTEVVVCDSCVTNHPPLARRLKVCGTPMHGLARIRSKDGRAFVADKSTCGSMACPVCGPTVRGGRAEEFGDAITGWLSRGPDHDAWMIRLSARNTLDTPLSDGRARALKGWSRLTNRAAWKRLRLKYGLHYIRSLETTHGDNGWNAHLQPVFLTKSDDPARVLADLNIVLRSLWPGIMADLGFYADPAVAVHVKQVDANRALGAAEYLAKSGAWNIGQEIARGDLKVGKGHGRTYEQIVADYDADPNRGADLALIREYHRAMYGHRLFSWSEGFRELLGMAPEKSDEDLAVDEPSEADDLAVADGRVLYTLQRRRQLADMLREAELGGLPAIYEFIVTKLGYPPGSVVAPRPDLTRKRPPRDGPGRYSRTEWVDAGERHHVSLAEVHATVGPVPGCMCEACRG